MKAKIRILDMFSGRYTVLINEEDAKEAKLHPDDLVKIEAGKKAVYGSVALSNLVGKGEVGISRDVLDLHNFSEGETVSVIPAGTQRASATSRRRCTARSSGRSR